MRRLILTTMCAFTLTATIGAQSPTTLGIRVTAQRPLGSFTLVTLASDVMLSIPPADLVMTGGETVLRISAVEATWCVPAALVTLASGQKVIVPNADLVDRAVVGERPARCNVVVPVSRGLPAGALPVDSAALVQIRALCAKEWPGDFRMQNYCEEQQIKALDALRQRR